MTPTYRMTGVVIGVRRAPQGARARLLIDVEIPSDPEGGAPTILEGFGWGLADPPALGARVLLALEIPEERS